MDINIVVGIMGVVATLIGSLLGVYYMVQQKKYSQIRVFHNYSISLFESIVKNLDAVEINLNGEKIDESLILFQITFANTGTLDIEKDLIFSPVKISLPQIYHWKVCRVIKASEGINLKIDKSDDSVTIEWDMLKVGEFFVLDSLVEAPSHSNNSGEVSLKNLFADLSVRHRIKHLREIKKEKSFPSNVSLKSSVRNFILTSLILGVVAFFSAKNFYDQSFNLYTTNPQQSHENSTFYRFSSTDFSSVVVHEITGDIREKKVLDVNEFAEQYNTEVYIEREIIGLVMVYTMALLYLIAVFFFLTQLVNDIRERKLYNKLQDFNA